MRASTLALPYTPLAILIIAGFMTAPAHAQSNQPAFRPATWGMTPADVQSIESGTRLQGGRQDKATASLDRVEAYVDVIRGKVGKIVYGFVDGRLVYSGFRFKLKKRDRSFSQRIGAHLRTRYGESEHVEASNGGRTIRLHWSTARTKIIGQFAPDALHVQFWDAQHARRRDAPSQSGDGPDE